MLPVALPVAELPPDAGVAEQVGVGVAAGVALAHAVGELLAELVAVAGWVPLVEYAVPSAE